MVVSVALDLGTTRIKAARLNPDGQLSDHVSAAAPEIQGIDPIQASDANAWLELATFVLKQVCQGGPDDVPVGITSQRSSFVIWDRDTGQPEFPLISWKDRRAMPWCRRNEALNDTIRAATGLLLSPHYLGPKFAELVHDDRVLHRGIMEGRLILGTLESWLIWHWTDGAVHCTDHTMASRTLLMDPRRPNWDDELLKIFHVPGDMLPTIVPSRHVGPSLSPGGVLHALIADQPAGVLATIGTDTSSALINFGTGTFVLRPTGPFWNDRPGYLTGPLMRINEQIEFGLEGTINGGGSVADVEDAGPTVLPEKDPCADLFCLPDASGVGAPWWNADLVRPVSVGWGHADAQDRRRAVLEGLIFRVAGVLDDLEREDRATRVVVSGGLTREPFIARGLANVLDRPVEWTTQPDASLLGAARLAAGSPLDPAEPEGVIEPEPCYLPEKRERWKGWMKSELGLG